MVEDHFTDFKSAKITPSKVQETFVAFANADSGDIWIGVEDKKVNGDRIVGYNSIEEANDLIKVLLRDTSPVVENIEVEFINFGKKGYVLHVFVPKSIRVHYTTSGDCFVRLNASSIKIKGEKINSLSYSKGSFSYERTSVEESEVNDFVDSPVLADYLKRIGSELSPISFLKKQKLISSGKDPKPFVNCVLLFDEEPQATLSTRCAIKVFRILTSDEYKREQLNGAPQTINGPIEQQIYKAIKTVNDLLADAKIEVDGKMVKMQFPEQTIHEILVNAVLHRDYSVSDDIHIRIFDNRVEIISPGRLPGYITLSNIYSERYMRNPNLVRMLHNLPNPVNHDIGEGLDTARNEMKKAGLIDPIIEELTNSVKVTIKYKKRIASLEEVIIKYFEDYPEGTLTNKTVRELSGEDDINKVKSAIQKLRRLEHIEPVNSKVSAFKYSYKKVNAKNK